MLQENNRKDETGNLLA